MAKEDDALFTINISLAIRAGVIVAVIIIVLTVTYYFVSNSLKETIIFFTAAITAGGAILTAFYAARALETSVRTQNLAMDRDKEQVAWARRETAMRYGERWNDPNMYHVRDVCREIFTATLNGPGEERLNQVIQEKQTNVIHFLNFLEDVAISIKNDLANPDLMLAQFEGITIDGIRRLLPWIERHRRERGLPHMWEHAITLADLWGSRKKP